MGFLKVIMGIAVSILLLIFLNNLMAMIFPVQGSMYNESDSAYSKCSSLRVDYISDANGQQNAANKATYDKYNKCISDAQTESSDKAAIQSQYIWMRAIVVLLIFVGIAILLFKKFPFYSGSLIAGGLLFAITYPIFATTGFSFDFLSGGGDLSASVRQQTQMLKMITSFIGFGGLTLADIFFFEKNAAPNVPKPPVIEQN